MYDNDVHFLVYKWMYLETQKKSWKIAAAEIIVVAKEIFNLMGNILITYVFNKLKIDF